MRNERLLNELADHIEGLVHVIDNDAPDSVNCFNAEYQEYDDGSPSGIGQHLMAMFGSPYEYASPEIVCSQLGLKIVEYVDLIACRQVPWPADITPAEAATALRLFAKTGTVSWPKHLTDPE